MQFASDAVFSAAGSRISLPARLHPDAGVTVYRAIERIAPAPFVEGMLARAAFASGHFDEARRQAARLPNSSMREEFLGRIAQAQGNDAAAQAHFLAGADFFAIQDDIDRLAARSPVAAYALQLKLKNRLEALKTHPDAVAESYWHLGQLSTSRADRAPAATRAQLMRAGMRDYRTAVALAPLSEKYLLAAGTQELSIGETPGARGYFARMLDVNPASADAYAGLGLVALKQGHRASAQRYAERSASIDPNGGLLHALQAALR